MPSIHRLSGVSVVYLEGADAAAVLHNLTTNEVKSLAIGDGCETFLTDVRGKTLAHVYAFRTPAGYRLIGAAGQSDAIVSHCDRYIIREDAHLVDRSDQFVAYAVSPTCTRLAAETDWQEMAATALPVEWLGRGTQLILAESHEAIERHIESLGEVLGDDASFHRERISVGFPWYGIDLSEKNLPQEAARIESSISFIKGCYLGQETVARLDALGQVQKQLVHWRTRGAIPEPGSEVKTGEKTVGRLTSVAKESDDSAIAIGMARRSHFDVGTTAEGEGFTATVIA